MFVYKHTETIQYVKQIQTSQVDNSRILRIKNAKFLCETKLIVKFSNL